MPHVCVDGMALLLTMISEPALNLTETVGKCVTNLKNQGYKFILSHFWRNEWTLDIRTAKLGRVIA